MRCYLLFSVFGVSPICGWYFGFKLANKETRFSFKLRASVYFCRMKSYDDDDDDGRLLCFPRSTSSRFLALIYDYTWLSISLVKVFLAPRCCFIITAAAAAFVGTLGGY